MNLQSEILITGNAYWGKTIRTFLRICESISCTWVFTFQITPSQRLHFMFNSILAIRKKIRYNFAGCVCVCLLFAGPLKIFIFPSRHKKVAQWWLTAGPPSIWRWPNVKSTLIQRAVPAGLLVMNPYSQQTQLVQTKLVQWWISVGEGAFDQHWFKVIIPMLILH